MNDTPAIAAPDLIDRTTLRTLEVFAHMAHGIMLSRLRQKAPIWGVSWRTAVYTDAENIERLRRAVDMLVVALDRSRAETATGAEMSEPWKRAADVANQAFMLADPLRKDE